MRISKFMLPALTVAGALALAGCGGGGDSMSDDDMKMDDDDNGNGYKALVEPKATFSATTIQTGQIGEEDESQVGNVIITCTDSDGCQWKIENGQLLIAGTYTHKLDLPPDPPKVSSAGNDNWLSDTSLLRGVLHDGSAIRLTKGNAVHQRTAAAEATATFVAPESGGLETTLRLQHTRTGLEVNANDADYLVFGAWEMAAGTSPGPDPKAEVVWAGSIPYVGVQSYRTGTATYTGNVLGHYKRGNVAPSAAWADWNGTASLSANFATQYVEGTITATSISEITSIALKKAKMADAVKGEIAGITDTTASDRTGKVTGTWNAQFFGPESEGSPTGIAGDFRADRAAAPPRPAGDTESTAAPRLVIQGAFGADTN